MRTLRFFLVQVVAAAFFACDRPDHYDEKASVLDSLGGAVHSALSEFAKTDTVLLEKCVTRFVHYKQFIRRNVNDTLDKSSADVLARFYESGNRLVSFDHNRGGILARAALVSSQLVRLSKDAATRSAGPGELEAYVNRERQEAGRLVETLHDQQKLFHVSLEEFRNSLTAVEQIIRNHNNGQLPIIVRDTLPL